MTLIELIENEIGDNEKKVLPYLDLSKSDSEIIESMKAVGILNFDNDHENQETE